MLFSTTTLYAVPLALIWLTLWFRVSSMRSSKKISIGDSADQELLLRIRQHGNCSDWSLFVLLLMVLAEGGGAQPIYIHVSGALLLAGRITHPFGLKIDNAGHPLRYVGNGTNILAALNALVCLGFNLFST